MKLGEVLQKTKSHFSKLGFESSGLDAELLLASSLGWKRLDLFLKQDYPMTEAELAQARELVRRRSKGEPVAYILGKKDFYNIELLVDKSVLIPRSETEHLVDEALAYCKEKNLDKPVILDLGAGSGCLGLAVLKELPEARLVSVERSKAAFKTLQKNAEHNGLQDRCYLINKAVEELSSSDLEHFGKIDVVLSNPPYIAEGDSDLDDHVLAFEPKEALFADNNGLHCYKTWPIKFQESLKEQAILLFEIGHKQGPAVKEIFNNELNYDEVSIIKDYAAKDRVLRALRS
jgi:release factor glutamine methyltransferase